MEEEEEAERQRQIMKQKREEQLALYLLSASPIVMSTPFEDQEGRARIEEQIRLKAEAKQRVLHRLIALCIIRAVKPETLCETLT